MVLTPIAPHMLTNRPIVIPALAGAGSSRSMDERDNVYVHLDGQDRISARSRRRVRICCAPRRLSLHPPRAATSACSAKAEVERALTRTRHCGIVRIAAIVSMPSGEPRIPMVFARTCRTTAILVRPRQPRRPSPAARAVASLLRLGNRRCPASRARPGPGGPVRAVVAADGVRHTPGAGRAAAARERRLALATRSVQGAKAGTSVRCRSGESNDRSTLCRLPP